MCAPSRSSPSARRSSRWSASWASARGIPGSRVAAQIVTGIGFLGAGTIIVLKGQVVGLTTAAGIWTAAAVGMAFGSGLWLLGVAGSILVVVVLRLTALEAVAGDAGSADGDSDERSKPG